MPTVRVVQISDEPALARTELFARLERLARVPIAARARFGVLLRDPQLDTAALCELGRELRARTRALGARLLVDDRVDVALALEADGVHLGRSSIDVADARRLLAPGAFVSRSCHGLDELAAIAAQGPDAVLLSPIFASPGKGSPLGLELLPAARARLPRSIALVALGGLDLARAAACLAAGADAVASIRADLSALC